MTTLTINTTPPIVLSTEILDLGPARSAVNGEVPSVSVRLDNARGELTALLARPPLRARATLVDGAGAVIFDGLVQSVSLGAEAVLELES